MEQIWDSLLSSFAQWEPEHGRVAVLSAVPTHGEGNTSLQTFAGSRTGVVMHGWAKHPGSNSELCGRPCRTLNLMITEIVTNHNGRSDQSD